MARLPDRPRHQRETRWPDRRREPGFACVFCNRAKGTDLGSITERADSLVRFFNPRVDRWRDHFQLDGARIAPLTEIGEVTVRILEINAVERLLEREALLATGRFPSRGAAVRLR